MKIKNIITSIGCLFITLNTTLGQIDPGGDGETNAGNVFVTSRIQAGSLAMRIISIRALTNENNGYLINTNYGWTIDSSNYLNSVNQWVNSPVEAQTNSQWLYQIGVINTSSNNLYSLETANNIANFTEFGRFIGTSTNTEFITNVIVSSQLELGAFRVKQNDGFIVYANLSSTNVDTFGSCPGYHIGYINYRKFPSSIFGWAPNTNYNVYTAMDILRNDTSIYYLGKYSDNNCASTNFINLPENPPSPTYAFTLFFKTNLPSGPYPLYLKGFLP